MSRVKIYNTKQKDLVLKEVMKHKEFTINDIHEKLKDEVGLTTIYRKIDELIKDGKVNKYIGKDNTTYYQYLEKCDEDNHFFLRCEECGDIEHVDCDCINELSEHIIGKHNFTLNKDNIVINGICSKCKKKEIGIF